MRIACTPGEAGGDPVTPLCAPHNRLVGPTTFPGTEALEQYTAGTRNCTLVTVTTSTRRTSQ